MSSDAQVTTKTLKGTCMLCHTKDAVIEPVEINGFLDGWKCKDADTCSKRQKARYKTAIVRWLGEVVQW